MSKFTIVRQMNLRSDGIVESQPQISTKREGQLLSLLNGDLRGYAELPNVMWAACPTFRNPP